MRCARCSWVAESISRLRLLSVAKRPAVARQGDAFAPVLATIMADQRADVVGQFVRGTRADVLRNLSDFSRMDVALINLFESQTGE